MNQLIINSLSREKRFVLIKNGTLENIHIEQPGQQSLVGNIYLGIVEKVIPGMNAAFVNFGEETSGFLSRDKLASFVQLEAENKQNRSISSLLHQGEKLLVQVEKDAAGTKGAKLTGIIELEGKNLIYMPAGKYVAVSKKAENPEVRDKWRELGKNIKSAEEGLIFRTESFGQNEEEITRELEQHRANYREIQRLAEGLKRPGAVYKRDYFFEQASAAALMLGEGSVIADSLELKKNIEASLMHTGIQTSFYSGKENIFSFYKMEQEIEKLLKRIVWLEKGAYLVIDQAEALTVIDVNTGKFSGKNNVRDTILTTNLQAAAEAARQIRLRDLAGMILIDYIDMNESHDRDLIISHMQKELRHDGRRTRIIGFTELGILQLTRKKTKRSLTETLTEKCGTCQGTGQVLSAETVAYRLERELWEFRSSDHEAVLIAATSEVISHVSGEADVHKARLETAIGLKINFTVTQSASPAYEILKFIN